MKAGIASMLVKNHFDTEGPEIGLSALRAHLAKHTPPADICDMIADMLDPSGEGEWELRPVRRKGRGRPKAFNLEIAIAMEELIDRENYKQEAAALKLKEANPTLSISHAKKLYRELRRARELERYEGWSS